MSDDANAEAFLSIDRLARTPKIRAGATARARRLRKAPTRMESRLWERLRQLPIRFRRQAPIGPYVVDFACLKARLVVEVDGGIHDHPDVIMRDMDRDAWLIAQGFRVLRIPNLRVRNDLDAVVSEIETLIRDVRPGSGSKTDVAFRSPQLRASTPTQPSPLEGEGFRDC